MKMGHQLAPAAAGPSVRGIAAALFRRKWLVTVTLATGILAAAVASVYIPDKYQSRMKILVRNVRAEVPVSAGSEAQAARSEVSESQILSEIELLKSRDLLESLARQAGLVESEKGGAATEADLERAVKKLEKDISISPIRKANLIEVTYSATTAARSTEVLKRLSELYLEKHLQVHHPPGAYDFFREQAQTFEEELKGSQDRLSKFQQAAEVVDIEKQKELLMVRMVDANAKLKDLDGSINDSEKRIEELKRQLGGMESRVITQSRSLPNQFSAERLNTMLVELRNKRIQLLTKFQPTDRVVREVDDQIRETTEALQKATQTTAVEQATDLNPLRQLLESELSKVTVEQRGRTALRENVAAQVAQYRKELDELEKATTRHSDLVRNVRQSETNFQLYAKKEEESRINDALDKQKFSNVSIAEAPTLPQSPDRNNQLLLLAGGLGFGTFFGLGTVFLSELMRETVLTPEELERISGYSVVATLPRLKAAPQDLGLAEMERDFDEVDLSELAAIYDDAARLPMEIVIR
jgi:uncharacterized protein involved in exopolysaccharide biosynthesis